MAILTKARSSRQRTGTREVLRRTHSRPHSGDGDRTTTIRDAKKTSGFCPR
jgi:hypothetical protein